MADAEDDSKKAVERKLRMMSEQLRELSFPASTISLDLAAYVADAFDAYLQGRARSLDAAFGLTAKRGAPSTRLAEHKAIAAEILAMKREGKSWVDITEALQSCGISDERELRRLYVVHRVEVVSKAIVEGLRKHDKSR